MNFTKNWEFWFMIIILSGLQLLVSFLRTEIQQCLLSYYCLISDMRNMLKLPIGHMRQAISLLWEICLIWINKSWRCLSNMLLWILLALHKPLGVWKTSRLIQIQIEPLLLWGLVFSSSQQEKLVLLVKIQIGFRAWFLIFIWTSIIVTEFRILMSNYSKDLERQ